MKPEVQKQLRHRSGSRFDAYCKNAILQENMRRNNGVLRNDRTGRVLEQPTKHTRGVTPPANEAQVDHITSGIAGDSNNFNNAQVIDFATKLMLNAEFLQKLKATEVSE